MTDILDKETYVWFGVYKGYRWDAINAEIVKWYYKNLKGKPKERAEKELRSRYHGKLDWRTKKY